MSYRELVDWGSDSGSAWSASFIALGSLLFPSNVIGTSSTAGGEGPAGTSSGWSRVGLGVRCMCSSVGEGGSSRCTSRLMPARGRGLEADVRGGNRF